MSHTQNSPADIYTMERSWSIEKTSGIASHEKGECSVQELYGQYNSRICIEKEKVIGIMVKNNTLKNKILLDKFEQIYTFTLDAVAATNIIDFLNSNTLPFNISKLFCFFTNNVSNFFKQEILLKLDCLELFTNQITCLAATEHCFYDLEKKKIDMNCLLEKSFFLYNVSLYFSHFEIINIFTITARYTIHCHVIFV
nr:hypothetical protein [Microctonus hyperodae filamentous virus]